MTAIDNGTSAPSRAQQVVASGAHRRRTIHVEIRHVETLERVSCDGFHGGKSGPVVPVQTAEMFLKCQLPSPCARQRRKAAGERMSAGSQRVVLPCAAPRSPLCAHPNPTMEFDSRTHTFLIGVLLPVCGKDLRKNKQSLHAISPLGGVALARQSSPPLALLRTDVHPHLLPIYFCVTNDLTDASA